MKLRHTPQTARILKTVKVTDPEIDLSDLDKIEARFREFSLDSKKQLFEDELPSNSKKKGVFIENKLRSKKEDLKLTIKQYYNKQNEEQYIGLINPIVAYFGNVLISSVFQALIVKTMHDSFKLRGEVDEMNFFSSKLLKNFGIDIAQLKSIKSREGKLKFIQSSMNNSIEKMLKNWREKIDQREKNTQDNQKEGTNSVRNGVFGWLKLKTKKTPSKSPDPQKNNITSQNVSAIKNEHASPFVQQKQARSSSASFLKANSYSRTNHSEKG